MFNKYLFVITAFLLAILCACSDNSRSSKNTSNKIIIHSDEGGRLIQAAMYPIYVIFLKGGDTESQKENWVDKDYWASLDILEGEDKGKSVLFKLSETGANEIRDAIETWSTDLRGLTKVARHLKVTSQLRHCDGDRKELRFKADIQWAADAPEAFKDRNFSEHPDLPGDEGQELLDKVRLVIYKD